MPVHFEPDVEFVDLFLPINISSAARAKAFLWMIFHYHEGPNLANPFSDDHARRNPGKVPWLLRLSRDEQLHENVDPPEEVEWGKKMAQARSRFLQDLVAGGELDKAARTLSGSSSYGSSLHCVQYSDARHPSNGFVDAESSSARRARTQPYFAPDVTRTTFHHYVPTNGGKAKPSQPVPLTGLILSTT